MAQWPNVEQLFTPAVCVGGAKSLPAVTQSLRQIREDVETKVTEFTAWKTQELCLAQRPSGTPTVITTLY